MKTPLVSITWPSIYPEKRPKSERVSLPQRMAKCTPDMKNAIEKAATALSEQGGKLYLSDLFRSYEMQTRAHEDYVQGRKTAYSPPAGGSLHEAGRAFDLELESLHISLKAFWDLAKPFGLVPIINAPTAGVSESWHFECRGSHQIVYDHYKAGKGNNFPKPYNAMAASAICSVGIRVDKFGGNQDAAYVQSGLIRLGVNIGNLDADIGQRTRDGLTALGIGGSTVAEWVSGVGTALKAKFPNEF